MIYVLLFRKLKKLKIMDWKLYYSKHKHPIIIQLISVKFPNVFSYLNISLKIFLKV